MLQPRRCQFCEEPILGHRQDPHCGAFGCKMEWLKAQQKRTGDYWKVREAKHREDLRKRFDDWVAAENVDSEVAAYVEVPHCNREETDVPKERVAAIVEHIHSLLSTLSAGGSETVFRSPFDTHKERSVDHLLGSMCATCNGKCCNKGNAQHAFIQRATLFRVLEQYEEVTNENIVSLYQSYIPEQSIADSCIYHTSTGCNLPDQYRADICGEFFCLKLNDFIDTFYQKKSPEKTMVFSTHECEIKKINILN